MHRHQIFVVTALQLATACGHRDSSRQPGDVASGSTSAVPTNPAPPAAPTNPAPMNPAAKQPAPPPVATGSAATTTATATATIDVMAFARECAVKLDHESRDANIVIDGPRRVDGGDHVWVEFKEKRSTPVGPHTLDVTHLDGHCHWIPGE